MSFKFPLILDGGLASELERSFGKDLTAGANVATTCSYQACLENLSDEGFSRDEAITLLKRSVRLARQARDDYAQEHSTQACLVALSLGCYGAVLANGAEYTGTYGEVTREQLVSFHKQRLEILLEEPGVDFIIFETIPSFLEIQAIHDIIAKMDKLPPVAVSFSCKSNTCISDGTPLQLCLDKLRGLDNLFAVGVNCTKLRYIDSLLEILHGYTKAESKVILLYPDGGEEWNAETRSFETGQKVSPETFGSTIAGYVKRYGPRIIIGGCCGIGPDHINSIFAHLNQ
ncbi:Homocysteine S-methyltransferase [Radiomyces spectabilis]|uniref:Homocysteine S-methyltransferase n=1 Tax=Radiomyces spectabilis TaxID=64574 RepID=UPI0022204869|nr:Homocysteine S-methyltransferase [Radiomyces spectabilis]KAI8388019.1 Homocysteine S-methyltransferase [Radiomyces spectabilis]